MQKIPIPSMLIVACLFSVGASQLKENKSSHTIRDYFLLLPDDHVDGISRNEREKILSSRTGRLKTLDLKNGYLHIAGDAGSPEIMAALFKKPDGDYLIGLSLNYEMGDQFYVLLYSQEKWEEVTEKVIPNYSPKLYYNLPHYGTTIDVHSRINLEEEDMAVEIGPKIYSLAWKTGRFFKD